jgi:hypothetical protein
MTAASAPGTSDWKKTVKEGAAQAKSFVREHSKMPQEYNFAPGVLYPQPIAGIKIGYGRGSFTLAPSHKRVAMISLAPPRFFSVLQLPDTCAGS